MSDKTVVEQILPPEPLSDLVINERDRKLWAQAMEYAANIADLCDFVDEKPGPAIRRAATRFRKWP